MFHQSYEHAVKNAEHFKAIGETNLWLEREGDKPWQHVSDIKEGCCVRIDVRTDAHFVAVHPCGLTFNWTEDLEDRDANGRGVYGFNVKAIRAIAQKLPAQIAVKFAAMLKETAKVIRTKADEWQRAADEQRQQAIALERILDG